MAADPTVVALGGNPIIVEAKKRWDRCSEYESTWRIRFLNDWRFANGDSDNGYQWPNAIRQARGMDDRPCLTMNITRQHNLQIVNEARRNKSAIKIVPLGNGATADAAQVYSQIIRHIEYQSEASMAYTLARKYQVAGGIGWWRLTTDYAGPDTDDQEIKILPVLDPLSIYIDPDAKSPVKSDSKFGFVFDSLSRDSFNEAYPKYKDLASQTPLGLGSVENSWHDSDDVGICEYFRKVAERDELISFIDPREGIRKRIRAKLIKDWDKADRDKLLNDPMTKIRETEFEKIEWRMIVGEQVVDETLWLGKWIPLIPVIGEEIIVDGILDRKGHTRAMKDAQRMYNYNSSSQVEFVALQGKTPWVAPAKAIEELESMWNTANTVNHSVLIYNHIDDNNPDSPIPPPTRTEAPNFAPAFQQGMETAFNQMMMTSGQWQNSMGMAGNERTGRAISERQEQSDTSTYHFQDAYGDALRFTAKQILDLFPKVYDTNRVSTILADDGMDMEIEIDPSARQAFQTKLDYQGRVIQRILNPTIGRFDVAGDVGPSLGSKRQQTVDALTLVLTQAPNLVPIIGDLLMKSMDFEEAQEAAIRLRRMVPPMAMGQGLSESEQALQTQVEAARQALAKSLQAQGKQAIKLSGKAQARDIGVHEAETKRISALAQLASAQSAAGQMGSGSRLLDELRPLIEQLVKQAMQTDIGHIQEENKGAGMGQGGGSGVMESSPGPSLGAMSGLGTPRRAPDGQMYVSDPTRPGKYLRVRGG